MIDDVASFAECSIESLKTNTIINAKMESKKLKLGQKKCFNIHIGNNSEKCHGLRVHSENMNSKSFETYLGDVVCSSGSNNRNINRKVTIGIGAVSQIISMLNQVSLGHYYFEIALVMRETMLISKIVSNSEVWYNISKDQYSKLERIDEMFIRRIFNLPISVPKESLYIETGALSIKYLIKIRRMMYLWQLLHTDKKELKFKFYSAQSLECSKDDWVEQVRKDKVELNLQVSDTQIIMMSQDKFRRLVICQTKMMAIKSMS